jgi:hypothetical protein
MPLNDQRKEDIDFLIIDVESNYFNTSEQVKLRRTRWFKDTTIASKVSGSNEVTGLFSRVAIVKDDAIYNSPAHATSSTIVDSSGGSRKILSLNVDYYASSSYDAYRTGIEITEDKHWIAGLAKISAGTPGHLYENLCFGYSETSIISEDEFIEIDLFDPVKYVKSGGDPSYTTFPIITGDFNQVENYILNGIIEPFPIRSVISNFSINFPFEPHSIKAGFGCGNTDTTMATSQIVGVDVYSVNEVNNTPFLDAVDLIGISNEVTGVFVGPSLGYFTTDTNKILPFEDFVYPRGYPLSSSYGQQMSEAILGLPALESTYVSRKQKSASTGFMYDNAPSGTDSIAYGGMLY